MSKLYKLAVVIGRFQIFHNGHKGLIDHALSIADRVLVIIGSSNESRTERNPFTADERHEMIQSVYPASPIIYQHQNDHPGDDARWTYEVDRGVTLARMAYGINRHKEVVIVGHRKDETSFYLDLFLEYQFEANEVIYHAATRESGILSSTDLRKMVFGSDPKKLNSEKFIASVPPSVFDWLMNWWANSLISATRPHLHECDQ